MEQPNLSVIKEISGGDIEFQNSILDIIKIEFPSEVISFKENFKANNLVEAANNVHKIKHKISLLGLHKGLELASEFETLLKEGNTTLQQNFLDVLDKIHVYLCD